MKVIEFFSGENGELTRMHRRPISADQLDVEVTLTLPPVVSNPDNLDRVRSRVLKMLSEMHE